MDSFQWSTPERRSGNQELPPIPNEIYLEIFSYLEPSDEITEAQCKATFSKIVFVCRFFCSVALPRLYRSLEFRGRKRQSSSVYGSPSRSASMSVNFSLAINKRSPWACDLACHVKDCTFEDWIPEISSQGPLYAEFLRVYCRAMVKMEEIQSLTLDHVIISHRMLKSIAKLKKLKRLAVRECELAQGVTELDISALRSLPIDEFTLVSVHQRSTSPLTLFQGIPNTSQVILHASAWDDNSMSTVMSSQLTRLTLETLSYETNLHQLAHVLNHLPSLTHLTVATLSLESVSSAGDPDFPLEASSLPRLRALSCPPLLAILFPKRALNELDITGYNISTTGSLLRHVYFNARDRHTQTFGQTTAAIQTLSIRDDMVSRGDAIIRYFPHLKTLRVVCGSHDDKTMTRVLKDISEGFHGTDQGYLPICELEVHIPLIQSWMVNLQVQHKAIVMHIQTAFFQITRVNLAAGVQWHRNDVCSDWQAYVQPARIEATLLLRAMDLFSDNVADYRRCFAKAGLLDREIKGMGGRVEV
ncbi:uncharacterized protein BT62DRAFT_482750 [Guyanagaster necrorhizus]|uniref:F-box domain-containing protein n=1 Tax=Guyanagaster necrorhizus TaxID=856835 RepID=A0A9P8AN55_9AGAR|nr:uncharacterized protein BT62DRAFT_482750 [Guyanagaster necrorhizus MCA 3950]KAG7441530.1 hypothetical protein BT62DRAFT_482750 [Guyanagaster necrorhizus MCA 3950]